MRPFAAALAGALIAGGATALVYGVYLLAGAACAYVAAGALSLIFGAAIVLSLNR